MAESQSFSESLDELLEIIRPHGRSITVFPWGLSPVEARREGGEGLHAWFARVVDRFAYGEPTLCAIEPKIAVFAALFWRADVLVGANISGLVTSVGVEDFYLGKSDPEAVCLRLDLDYQALGKPFSHPLPHIHMDANLSPRFALDAGDSGNVVLNYFDFLYRNFEPSQWRRWAERQWNQFYSRTGRSPEEDPFPLLMTAFEENQFAVLRQHERDLTALKKVLQDSKDEYFGYPMAVEDRRLLAYA
ncbi:MAG TPA: hypothetical protein VEI07_20065 [Planctomycetaceae bacterium]|nr:hypothetical protein [Planctomycetaceae bacterium]